MITLIVISELWAWFPELVIVKSFLSVFQFLPPSSHQTKLSELAVARLDLPEEAFKEPATILFLFIMLVWLLVYLWFLPYL